MGNGTVSKNRRANGLIWVYRFQVTRAPDGKRVENIKILGLVKEIGPSEAAAWREVGRLGLNNHIAVPNGHKPSFLRVGYAGVIPKGYKGRFGWHNLRHSLATFFAANDVNLPVIQRILRHSRPSMMALYTYRVNAAQMAAQGKFLDAIKVTAAVA
jgi:integrase